MKRAGRGRGSIWGDGGSETMKGAERWREREGRYREDI